MFQLAERAITSIYPVMSGVTQQTLSVNNLSDAYHTGDDNRESYSDYNNDSSSYNEEGFYAMPMRGGTRGRGGRPMGRPMTTEQYDVRKMVCFHCGVAGHRAWKCMLATNRQPQTTSGAAAWARYCETVGGFTPYVPRWSPFPAAASSSSSSSAPSPTPSIPSSSNRSTSTPVSTSRSDPTSAWSTVGRKGTITPAKASITINDDSEKEGDSDD